MHMQAFKRRSAAEAFAKGGAIIQISSKGERLYVAIAGEELDLRMTGIELFDQQGKGAAFVTLDHFDRLGNACHAESDPRWTMPGTLRLAPPTDASKLGHDAADLDHEVRS
jgi:hypothetical protein